MPAAPPSIDLAQAPCSEAAPASRAETVAASSDRASLLPRAAIVLGLLSAMIALAGPSAAHARLPLAILAFAALAAADAFRSADASESAPWTRLLPAIIAIGAAVAASVTKNVQADRLASFAGLVCASVAIAAELGKRARRNVDDARNSIASRLDVSCRVAVGDEARAASVLEVKPGDAIVVEPDETVGVDGTVASGEAEVLPFVGAQTSMKKKEGDPIVAGARVLSGRLRIATTFAGADRAFARSVGSSAHRADVSDPQIAFLKRTFERAVVPISFLAGVFAFALGGSIPVALASAAGALAAFAASGVLTGVVLCVARAELSLLERGIVYKDGRAFDLASKVDVAVVCSRGTVLLGEPELVSIESFGLDEDRVLSLAAGAETASTHPFAAAVQRAAKTRGLAAEPVRSAVVHAGLGVTALAAGGDRIVVGSRAFLLKERVSIAAAEGKLSELEAQGRSVLLVSLAGKLVGLIALQDGLRPGARAAMRRLHEAHIEPVLLSGESRDTCETIARALEIDHVRPEVLSQERGTEVRALREGGHIVAVIGHPATDDGALGGADVAVALLALASSPSEWAVALASDDARDAALALTVPKSEKERARRALLFGAVLPVTSVLGAALGLIPLELGPIAGVGAVLASLWAARPNTA
jgi:cation transport ATPase